MGISQSFLILICVVSFSLILAGCSSEEPSELPPITYVSSPNYPPSDPPLQDSMPGPVGFGNRASLPPPPSNDIAIPPPPGTTNYDNVASNVSTPVFGSNETNIEDTSNHTPWTTQYEQVLQQAVLLSKEPQQLAQKAEQLLQNQSSDNPGDKNRCMMLAVISAAGYYWIDDVEKAHQMAEKAFQYRDNQTIAFPNSWKLKDWYKAQGTETASKLAQTKDFILSSSNGGANLMADANRALLARAKFLDAMNLYQQSLERGVQDADLRRAGYLRFAGCLFKANRLSESEEVFLHAWLLNHDLEMDFGDVETREFIDNLGKKYPE